MIQVGNLTEGSRKKHVKMITGIFYNIHAFYR